MCTSRQEMRRLPYTLFFLKPSQKSRLKLAVIGLLLTLTILLLPWWWQLLPSPPPLTGDLASDAPQFPMVGVNAYVRVLGMLLFLVIPLSGLICIYQAVKPWEQRNMYCFQCKSETEHYFSGTKQKPNYTCNRCGRNLRNYIS